MLSDSLNPKVITLSGFHCRLFSTNVRAIFSTWGTRTPVCTKDVKKYYLLENVKHRRAKERKKLHKTKQKNFS